MVGFVPTAAVNSYCYGVGVNLAHFYSTWMTWKGGCLIKDTKIMILAIWRVGCGLQQPRKKEQHISGAGSRLSHLVLLNWCYYDRKTRQQPSLLSNPVAYPEVGFSSAKSPQIPWKPTTYFFFFANFPWPHDFLAALLSHVLTFTIVRPLAGR